ncbi:hypothetical protein L6164_005595 [Bauhinia variegata]|uniref:Uncharacterized protein n=1 Tax=Bauhinia variegata TaxID=167791 RepID=A0ACB9PRM9_BAUVA|nr:hypothetical protein L6164_005595 [Bauhinia variegata]
MHSNCSSKMDNAILNSNSTVEDHGNASGFTFEIIWTIVVILAVIITCFVSILRRRSSAIPNIINGMVARSEHGFDDNTLDSIPKLLYSEMQKGSLVSSCCSICLGDYKDTDTLRLLPECGHVFHLKCVDPWLKLQPTCPICRSSSVQTRQSSISTQETVVHVGR